MKVPPLRHFARSEAIQALSAERFWVAWSQELLAMTGKDLRYTASSGLPRTFGPNSVIAITTISIAAVIRPNTPVTPASFSM
ncbi:hypothetical protein PMI42_07813 [Bradyrhizobium sp. YR681]|nr:hypothetical protein PMI42_07813 [Bradyrhizobium sp. YR681]